MKGVFDRRNVEISSCVSLPTTHITVQSASSIQRARNDGVPVCRLFDAAVGLELTVRPVRDCSNPVDAEEDTASGTVGTTAERWTWWPTSLHLSKCSLAVSQCNDIPFGCKYCKRWATSVNPSLGEGLSSLGLCGGKLIFLPSVNGSVGILCR